MKILIACEFSGVVRRAFRERGHDAWSCDLLPAEDGSDFHFMGDVTGILDAGWDMMIAHPPCTYLCVPGAHYLHTQEGRWLKMEKAAEFFKRLRGVDIPKICVENPVPHHYADLPKYSQIIQPWQFGDPYSKRTGLWLKGLPLMEPTKIVGRGDFYRRKDGSVSNAKWYAKTNAKGRSRTFPGIAQAMAEQWG